MALVQCRECRHEISTKVDRCPNCGAPAKSGPGCLFWTCVVLIALVAIISVMMEHEGNLFAHAASVELVRLAASRMDALKSSG